MLRNVLADFLKHVTERDFDLPFLALLHELDFYDIHYTHGQAEFGKDFIAKRRDDGVVVQYSFQSKAGDIGQVDFRRDVLGQLLESLHLGIGHPSFDKQLPHQAVLVTTGRLVGNAPVEMQELNEKLVGMYAKRSVELWDQQRLLEYLLEKGASGTHAATAREVESYGAFYVLLGRIMQAEVSERDIEKHSRSWLNKGTSRRASLLVAGLESEVITQKCAELGFLYEAFYARLSALRAVLYSLLPHVDDPQAEPLLDMVRRAMANAIDSARSYLVALRERWHDAGKNLVQVIREPANMFTYLVHCARTVEVCAWLHFTESEAEERQVCAAFLREFIESEPGCGHLPSDRYATTMVLPTLALLHSGQATLARSFVQRAVIWLCDRYENGMGLGRWEASPLEELQTLLGSAFEFVNLSRLPVSYAACVLSDLAKLVEPGQLYGDVINDLRAVNLFGEYWQVPDTASQLLIDGPEVITYPNSGHLEHSSPFQDFSYAEHIKLELRRFRLADQLGIDFLFAMTILLRDRYWPGLWLDLLATQN